MAPSTDTDLDGLWGRPTTTWDWCERNYEVTFYVAEFWNTVTNLMMIIAAIKGMYDVHVKGIEKRYHMCYASLLLVGIGSWLFHMTLRYEMQLLDELPMVWGACVVMYCLYRVRSPPEEENLNLAIWLAILCLGYTVIYLAWPNPLIHFTLYGVLVVCMVLQDLSLAYNHYSFSCLRFYLIGCLLKIIAFILWNVDNVFCSNIEVIRSNVPLVITPLFQLHGWWHLLAGHASYLHIAFCIQHRQIYLTQTKSPIGAVGDYKKMK